MSKSNNVSSVTPEIMIKRLYGSGIFWTFFVGLASVLISLYLARQEREPVFYYHQIPFQVFYKSILNEDLKITFRDSVLLSDNIYATSIVFWNNGELPIETKDIRDSIGIRFPSDITVLDARVLEEYSDIGKSNFQILNSENNYSISWDFFDPGSACKIQLIYSSKKAYKPVISGSVLGNRVALISGEFKGVNFWGAVVFFPFFIYFILRFMQLGIKQTKWKEIKRKDAFGIIIILLLALVSLGICVFIFFKAIAEYNYLPF